MPRKRKLTSQTPIPSGADAGKAKLLTLGDLDGRTIAAKRAKALVSELETDLGGDLSAAQRTLVHRAAAATALVEHMEALWLAGHGIDVPAATTLTNTLSRILGQLGLERRPRDVTPSLSEWAAGVARRKAEAAAAPTTIDAHPFRRDHWKLPNHEHHRRQHLDH
jgi:hypothetical protein